MKKRFAKLAIAAALVSGISLGTASTNKAEARIFPATKTSDCLNGQIYSYHTGWFGSNIQETVTDC